MNLFWRFCFGFVWSLGGIQVFEKLNIRNMNGFVLSLVILLCGPIVWIELIKAWLTKKEEL